MDVCNRGGCERMWYGWKTPLTNYLIGCFCTQLYTADGDKKAIFPIMLEDVDFSTNELARGVKFVISGVNWTMCRPGVDDYNSAISKLMQGMKEKGTTYPNTKQKQQAIFVAMCIYRCMGL